MAQKCQRCRERGSKGSIGQSRLCYECVASLTGETKRIVSSRRVQLSITRGRMFLGFTEWVPDFIAARYKRRTLRPVEDE